MHSAVFLDRDGLINRQAKPHHYISRPEDLEILPGVPEAIKLLNDSGYLVLIVTNQRGVARGMLTMEEVEKVHGYLCSALRRYSAHIDGIYVCPHNDGECTCRKPDIGLFLQASEDFEIDRDSSWMVGDSDTDVEAGRRFGVRTIRTTDLYGAVQEILTDAWNWENKRRY